MIPRLRALSIALYALATTLTACSTNPEGADDPSAVGEDDITREGLLDDVGAVKINGSAAIAAPAKLQRVLANIGLQRGAPTPPEGAYRCMPKYRLELLTKAGESFATAGFLCGGAAAPDRKNAKGSITVDGKSYLLTARDVDALDAIAREAPAVGDILFGADHVTFKSSSDGASRETKDASLVARIVASMKVDQLPDANADDSRCVPSRVIGFYRAAAEVAFVGLDCSDDAKGIVKASLSAPSSGISGAIDVDADLLLAVERELPIIEDDRR